MADLCAAAGMPLDGWQQYVLEHGLGERANGTWAAFECGLAVPRQNGKGGVIEARELGGLFLFGEKLILHSAHHFKTAHEAFRRIYGLIEGCDDLRRRVKKVNQAHGEEGIELHGEAGRKITGGQRLRFLARTKGSGRGFTGDCNILDEAQELTPEQVSALLPTMSAIPNPQLWYLGTPPRDGAGYFASVRQRGFVASQSGDPGRLAWFEYSPPDGFDRTDPEVWRATNPAIGIRISEEFVSAELAAMSHDPAEFDRERLGLFPPDPGDGWAIIAERDWRQAADPRSAAEDPVAFAIACNPERTWASIGVAGRRDDGLRHIELVERRQGTGWVAERVAELSRKWKPCAVGVVAAGPAGSLIPDIELAGVEVLRLSTADFARACGILYDGIAGTYGPDAADTRNIRYSGAPERNAALSAAMKVATKREVGDVWAFDRDVPHDMSALEAVTCALFAWISKVVGDKIVIDGDLFGG